MQGRAIRRWQQEVHIARRVSEDRNQHYNDLACPCWYDPKAIARFREQPKHCGKFCCSNRREYEGPTLQEKRNALDML